MLLAEQFRRAGLASPSDEQPHEVHAFPLREASASSDNAKASSIMSKILIVDDDRVTRHVLRKVLTGAGFSTSVAKDGVEALKALGTQRFDLLLLDVWMPRMTGLDVLASCEQQDTPTHRRDDLR